MVWLAGDNEGDEVGDIANDEEVAKVAGVSGGMVVVCGAPVLLSSIGTSCARFSPCSSKR